MAKKSKRNPMSSEEYQRCIIEQGKSFLRCDKSGTPDQNGDARRKCLDAVAASRCEHGYLQPLPL
jgi:hypothetical protein